MNHLELFSGTHSFGKVSSSLGYNVYSLDRDLEAECPLKSGYISQHHFKEDIMTWDYKIYPKGYFHLITASPVCTWWSQLRRTWIGRKLKSHGNNVITEEILDEDIEKYGVPMVDKVFEIIDYFNPQYYIIENPKGGKMKEYISGLIPYYDIDYCRYSDWGYRKTTRFWTNIEGLEFIPCNNKCDNMIENTTLHKNHAAGNPPLLKINDKGKIIRICTKELRKKYKQSKDVSINVGGGRNVLHRYRIPEKIIDIFIKNII